MPGSPLPAGSVDDVSLVEYDVVDSLVVVVGEFGVTVLVSGSAVQTTKISINKEDAPLYSSNNT